MTYLIVFLVLAFGVFFFELNTFNKIKKFSRIYIIFSYVILVLVAGLRFRIAPDSVAYAYFFDVEIRYLQDYSIAYISESRFLPLWLLICSISKHLGGYFVFQFLTASFCLFSVFVFIKRYSLYPIASTLFFYVFFYHYFTMEILREAVAISLFLLSVVLYNKSKVFAFILCLMAMLIHQFAFILIFLYLVILLKLNRFTLILSFLVLILIFVVVSEPLLQLQKLLAFLAYIDLSHYELFGELSLLGYINYLIKIFIPIAVMSLFFKRFNHLSESDKSFFFLMILFYSSMLAIRVFSLPFVERLVNYSSVFVIVLLSSLFLIYAKRFTFYFRNIFFTAGLASSIFLSLYPMTKLDAVNGNIPIYKRYYPYSSIFDQVRDSERELVIKLEAKE